MKHIFTIIFVLCLFSLWAQEVPDAVKKNSFQMDFGVNQLKDENLHTKVHTGILYGLIFEHCRQMQNISYFGIGLRYSRLKTKYEDLSASANIQIFGNYNYLFETLKKNKGTYFVGPEIRLDYNLCFYPNWDESHLYWGSCLDIGVKNRLNYPVNDNQTLKLDVGLSLFSVFSRPELDRQYKIDDVSFSGMVEKMHSDLEGGVINKSVFVSFLAEYQFHTSEKITQAICYSYNYRRLKSYDGLPFKSNLHQIGFKLYF